MQIFLRHFLTIECRACLAATTSEGQNQYIGSVSGLSDIGIKKSWFKKAMDTILGKEETSETLLRSYGVFAVSDRLYVTDPGNVFLTVMGRIMIQRCTQEQLQHTLHHFIHPGFHLVILLLSDKMDITV